MQSSRTKTSIANGLALAAPVTLVALVWIALMARGGIWLPDVLFGSARTLAFTALANGYRFRVEQHWNSHDSYSTTLRVTSPDGQQMVRTLDGDDVARRRVLLHLDENRRTVAVTLGGHVTTTRW